MKVLQINSVCGVGSTGRIATDIHDALTKNGHESYIAFGRKKAHNIERKYTIKIGGYLNVLWHVFMTRVFDNHGFSSKRATKYLIKQIEKLNPDIIHLHNLHGYYLNVEILFKYLQQKKVKVVWTLHDCWSITGHSAHFSHPKNDDWFEGIHCCNGKRNYPQSYIIDNRRKNGLRKKSIFTALDNMRIITPSEWLENLVNQSFLSKYDIKTINNGIDLISFKNGRNHFRKTHDLENKTILLGVASPFTEKKGLSKFIELSQKLPSEYVIVLVGLKNNQIKKLPKNIIGYSKTDSLKKLVNIYNGSDIFLNLTLEDTFPTTNIEALACGLPIITFDTGGSPEMIDSKTGIVIKNNDVDSIVEILEKIKSGIIAFNKEDSILRAHKLYNKNDRLADYLSIYQGIYDEKQ